MNQTKAIKIAIECINTCKQKYAWDANMYDKYKQYDYLRGKKSYDIVTEYRQAIEVLKGVKQQGKLF